MTEAERELREEHPDKPGCFYRWLMAWHEKHSPRVPSRAELKGIMINNWGNSSPKAIDDIFALMHPKPEWCKSDCPDPWKWHKDSFGRLSKQPCGVVVVAPHIKFCDCCGERRPE